MSSFQPTSYNEAKESFRPLKRSRMRREPRQADSTSGGLNAKRGLSSASGARNNARKAKSKKGKKLTTGQLKKRVWKVFSIFIRTRGADEHGFNRCVTCGVRKPWVELQAGHFIRGRLNANLFNEVAVWPQCYSCNIGRQGHVVIYYKFMLENYGQEVIDELISQNNQTKKWMAGELAELLEYYKKQNAAHPLLQDRLRPDGQE